MCVGGESGEAFAEETACGFGGDAVEDVAKEFAEVFACGLLGRGNVEAGEGDEGLMGEELEDDSEDGPVACGDDGEDLGCSAVDGPGEGSEGVVDGLDDGAGVRDGMAGDLFGGDEGWWGLAEGAGFVDGLTSDLGGRSDEPGDEADEDAFGDGAGAGVIDEVH